MSPEESRVRTPVALDAVADTVLRPEPTTVHGITPGTLLVNTYRVERLLGGGGMGEVYLARHTGLGTQHAIKVIRPSMAKERQVMDLFHREARVLRGVRHEAVVSYDGFVRDDQGRDYLVMEYVEGPSLADRLRRAPLSPEEVLTLRDRLAAGLAEAHRNGAVHRDIAPDNVILPANCIESAKLIDFGVCKLTDPAQETIVGSSFAGKYRYASPEQLGLFGGVVDARSDIYSLGLVLAAAAQGRPLAMGETIEAALRSRQSVPDLSGVSPGLREWLAAMLEPDPARRPVSLNDLLTRWPAGTRAQGPIVRDSKRKGQRLLGPRALFWGIGLFLLAGVGGGLYWILQPLPPEPPPQSEPKADTEETPGPTETPADSGLHSAGDQPSTGDADRLQETPAKSAEQRLTQDDRRRVEADSVVPGTRFSDPLRGGGSGPVMVWLPAGEFQMGSPPDESGRNPDEQVHLARVPEPIAMGETEVTLGKFRQFVQDTGYRTEVERDSTCLRPNETWQQLVPDMSLSWESPGYPVTHGHPVSCISWNDARAYAEWLTSKTGHQYRLPTELEWEYAARAGTGTSRYWGDDPKAGCRLANTAECKDDHTYTAPAGTFAPNPFGLRDMLGNLAEWTCSAYGKGYSGAESRCSDTAGSSPKVFRGGSWLDAPGLVRSAARDGAPANLGLNSVGFRLLRTLSP